MTPDEASQVIATMVIVLVFVALLLAANAGEAHHAFAVVAYAGLCGICAIAALVALAGVFAAISKNPGNPSQRVVIGSLLQFTGAAVAPMLLTAGPREGLAKLLKSFRAESPINAVSAALYVLVVTFYISQQVVTDQLQAITQSIKETGQSPSLVFIIATNQLPFVFISIAGVGMFVRRTPGAALERLGLYWPGWRWVGIAVLTAVGLVIFGFAFDQLMTRLTPQQSQAINDVSNLLLKDVSTPAAAVVLALAAGIGEELIFRGAVQPRFGIVAASVLFAVMHTQYAVSLASLEIFCLGLFLGLLRKRAGTIASMIAHTGYDLILLMLPYAFYYLHFK